MNWKRSELKHARSKNLSESQLWLKLLLRELARKATPKGDLHYYRSPEDFVVRAGRFFEPRVPRETTPGPMCQCYLNASRLALQSMGEFRYCEGYAMSQYQGRPFVCQHAWCCDGEGRLVETTWPLQSFGGDYAFDKVAYMGVAFSTEALLMSMTLKPVFTMLVDEYNGHPLLWHKYGERSHRETLFYLAGTQVGKRIMLPGAGKGEEVAA